MYRYIYIYIYICIYTLVLHMSPSGDKKYCCQGVLWDLAAVVTFLRSALKFAAVVAAQLGVHLASNWCPFGAHLTPRGLHVDPGGAQETQVEPKRRPGGPKMTSKGAPRTPS